MTGDLFAALRAPSIEPIADGATWLRAYADDDAVALMQAIQQVTAQAPFRRMQTPGGYTMSVAMSNCGELGWVTDRRGYRYQREDPLSQQPWPAMPEIFLALAVRADKPLRMRLESGDVVVWGGPARLRFHGVDTLAQGTHALTGDCRYNLTFRKAG
ncbi:alpha-ketoglutarate-dependent dioxygenase AlkB [Herbaspirillum lusitanum]|uniref:alpha-ketoglutarate-dependent dioxygenase AlkB n=1 Tax=Herbaspirillum lusitanum TaxID=213312 RepID=UPI00031D0E89|nr:alpha-ketoglutarate-dependent dioxygenase AlkB [Herbaspirillum lusitanum]